MQSGNTLNYVTLNQTEFYPVIQASFLVNEKSLADLILKIII
ncbi:MAG: hypothetical protein RI892_1294 [Pseudomonadota bacterium]|jgi:hypothetical protein